MSFIVGGAYLTGGRPSSVPARSRCGLGTGGAALCGIMFCDPGAFGAGRIGSILPFAEDEVVGVSRPRPCVPLGTGGGARGFSKLSPSFFGNRGLAGGLSVAL